MMGPARDPRAGILVVDDSAANRVAIEAILAPLNQEVVLAGSGREALRHLLRREFALILLDVNMGDINGFETAELIRQRPRSQSTPIIFLTAFDQAAADIPRGYALGAVDFIFSPTVPEVLRAKATVFVDLYQKTNEIRLLYAEAQEASQMKSEFLNMAAHELRTPLSVVAGYISMMADGTLGDAPEAWARVLEILQGKTGELNRIVDSLLLAARLDVGKVAPAPDRVDLCEAAREAVDRAEGRRAIVGAQITVRAPEEPVVAVADPLHVARVLDNLINNAMTYCSAARPSLKIIVSNSTWPRVTVEDNGVGVAPEMQDRIFERFVRIENDVLGPVQGTGLGLYISRELAQQSGGSLFLERSRPDHGSRFTLTLPPAPAEPRAPGDESSAALTPVGGTRGPVVPPAGEPMPPPGNRPGASESRSVALGAR